MSADSGVLLLGPLKGVFGNGDSDFRLITVGAFSSRVGGWMHILAL